LDILDEGLIINDQDIKLFGGTEWGLPLVEQAARDILAVDSSSSTTQRIISMMNAVGNGGFTTEVLSN
jgi:hypothetical protein